MVFPSDTRLMTLLNNDFDMTRQVLAASTDTTNYLAKAQDILNAAYNNDVKTLGLLKTAESTKLKQVQFNNYYAQKYNYNVIIMKILVFASVLVMICILLYTRDILPQVLYVPLIATIIAVTIIIIVTMIVSELRRSSDDFNKFWWYFDPATAINN